MTKKLLVTSALPYANGPIHLGHLVEVIQTDIFARWQRLRGRDVVYVCADDTHGTPIELSARKQGISPEALISRVHGEHRRDFADFDISFDEYGRTHTDENRAWAERIFERLRAGGYVVKRAMELTYCEKDLRFLPDRFVRGGCPRCGALDQYGDVCEVCKSTYAPTELKEPRCALCGTAPVRRSSEHYFFEISKFKELLGAIADGPVTDDPAKPGPEPVLDVQVRNFLKGWLKQGLQDWCVSRDGPYFGFPIPGEQSKFFYVWLDAPIGYISNTERLCQREPGHGTALGYWAPEADSEIWHFIGKDIIYFHALFWPAMLAGAKLKLPHRIVVHGMLNVRGEKMSKSRGRLRTAREYLDTAGLTPEQLRYYFAANLVPEPSDIDLNVEDFRHRVNAELVNNIANFCHRTLSLLRSQHGARLLAQGEPPALWAGALGDFKAAIEAYDAVDFRAAMSNLVHACSRGNEFLQEKKPWAVEGAASAQANLTVCANVACGAALLLAPVTPVMSKAILRQLGREGATLATFDFDSTKLWIQEGPIAEGGMLVPRIEPQAAAALLPEEPAELAADEAARPESSEIEFAAFAAVDLRCGLIVEAAAVEGAKKLLRLTVDLGESSPRTIASGIAERFAPAELVGRRVVVVANLQPRTIRGVRSHGMLLAAGEGKGLALVELPKETAPGTKVS